MIIRTRNQSGFSLATIIALGVVASLWMLGTASLVIPATAKLATERSADMERASAEAGLDWALNQLNNQTTRTNMLSQTSCAIPASCMADSSIYSSTSGQFTANTSKLTGTISISNVAPPYTGDGSAYTTYLYDQTVDPSNPSSTLSGGPNMWRVLTATVTNGVTSRAVRVILKPQINFQDQTTAQTQTYPPQPIFKYGAFGVASISGAGNIVVNSYDSRAVGSVTTTPPVTGPHPTVFQTLANVPGYSTLNPANWNLNYPGLGDVATNGFADFSSADGSKNLIGGNVEVFGGSTTGNYANSGPNFTLTGAVSSVAPNGFGGSQIASNPSTTPQPVPPVPPAPANPTALPGGGSSISLSGSNSSITLSTGNYVVNSISMSGNNSEIIIEPTSGPVNLWVQGTGGGPTPIAIAGQGVVNSSGVASNFNIFYSGTGAITVSGKGSFVGTILAPSAPITIAGNGDFYGAALGNTLALNGGGSFHYDRALMAQNSLFWTPPTTTIDVEQLAPYMAGWQAVSWHEFNPNSPY